VKPTVTVTRAVETGPDLDAAVAQKVFGREFECRELAPGQRDYGSNVELQGHTYWFSLPPYSSNIAQAWQVVEKMLDHPDQRVYLAFVNAWGQQGYVAPGPLAAERICRAALEALAQ